MLKILWERGEIAPEEQFLLLSTIFYLLLSFYVRTGTRISLRDNQIFEITEVEIAGVDCIVLQFPYLCQLFDKMHPYQITTDKFSKTHF